MALVDDGEKAETLFNPAQADLGGRNMKTYPLTTDQFNALLTRLCEVSGMESDITQTAEAFGFGTLEFKGVKLKYNYDGTNLVLSIMQKPFLIPSNTIWEQVEKWIAG